MSGARTTVVIGTRNRAEILLRTIERLRTLEPQPPIIVVDDDSHDDTIERLHALRLDVAQLRVIRMPNDVPAVALNLGADVARTPFVAFCADEVSWAPDALRKAEAIFDAHERLGLITANVLDPVSGSPDPLCAELARLPAVPNERLPGPSVLRFHTGATVLRRSAYLDTGGFDPMLHLATEEKLLAYDLAAKGWQLCYVDDVLAYHATSEMAGHRVRSRRLERRDRLVTTWMRRPLRECVRAGVALLRDATHDGPAALAALGALRRFGWAMVERELLPAEVEHRIRMDERSAG